MNNTASKYDELARAALVCEMEHAGWMNAEQFIESCDEDELDEMAATLGAAWVQS